MATKAKVKERSTPREVIGAFSDELGDLGEKAVKSFKRDFVEGSGKDFMSQLLGIVPGMEAPKPSGEKAPEANQDPTKGPVEIFNAAKLTPAEIAERQAHAKKEKKTSHAEAPMNHGQEMRDAGKRGLQKEKQQQRSEIEEIKAELHQIVRKTTQEAQVKYATHTLNESPKQVGKGTVTFFRSLVNSARITEKQASESGTWLGAAKGKNAKKGDFSLANGKMHQSGERTTVQNAAG